LNAEIRRVAGEAVALAPDNADAYYNRGLLHQYEKQYQSAIDDFTAASGLVPQAGRTAAGARAELPCARREASRAGFVRVGGEPGQSYDTF
jgi:tetratricopeptide (TPR) repeat protein